MHYAAILVSNKFGCYLVKFVIFRLTIQIYQSLNLVFSKFLNHCKNFLRETLYYIFKLSDLAQKMLSTLMKK